MLRAGTRCDLLMQVHNAELDGPFWKLAEADSGRSLRPVVNDDLAVLLRISLPPEWRDRGKESGRRLRAMRCQALAMHMAKRKRRMPMADGAGMAGAPLDVSGRKPGAAGGIHAVDSGCRRSRGCRPRGSRRACRGFIPASTTSFLWKRGRRLPRRSGCPANCPLPRCVRGSGAAGRAGYGFLKGRRAVRRG